MIPEIGHCASILGLTSAIGLGIFGFVGGIRPREAWVDMACKLAIVQFVLLLLSFLLLTTSFLSDNFSVLYVAHNSNTSLEWYYKISAVWGAHEGSFLFGVLVTSIWTMCVAIRAKYIPMEIQGIVLGTLGVLNAMFLIFLLASSNPFERLVPNMPLEGADLNPLLQDFGQIIHPPMLYIGYVGFAVAFGFGVAALITGRVDSAWARWLRPWVNIAWLFLTIGIALGSWWAYYELGWGGWWFWDPVENASLLPWLAGTALIHSLAATEKRGTFKTWTVLLSLAAFSLSLLGTFLVRSGVLSSVHAFAVDPQRGAILLGILGIVTGGALLLYAVRASTLRGRLQYWGISRELLLLINNALLTISLVTIMFGTLYPIGYEWFTGGEKLSVGPPYFNIVFIPLMLILTLFLAIAPISQWKNTPKKLLKPTILLLVIPALLAFFLPWILANELNFGVSCALALAGWVICSHIYATVRQRKSITMGFVGMSLAHIGFALAVIGVAVTSVYSHSQDARLAVGDSIELNGRNYELTAVDEITEENYIAERARFEVRGQTMFPERRFYPIRRTTTTEAAIIPGLFNDLYVSFGEQISDGTWGVRVQEKPFVRWIWIGAAIMALSALIACADQRYKRLARRDLKQLAESNESTT